MIIAPYIPTEPLTTAQAVVQVVLGLLAPVFAGLALLFWRLYRIRMSFSEFLTGVRPARVARQHEPTGFVEIPLVWDGQESWNPKPPDPDSYRDDTGTSKEAEA